MSLPTGLRSSQAITGGIRSCASLARRPVLLQNRQGRASRSACPLPFSPCSPRKSWSLSSCIVLPSPCTATVTCCAALTPRLCATTANTTSWRPSRSCSSPMPNCALQGRRRSMPPMRACALNGTRTRSPQLPIRRRGSMPVPSASWQQTFCAHPAAPSNMKCLRRRRPSPTITSASRRIWTRQSKRRARTCIPFSCARCGAGTIRARP